MDLQYLADRLAISDFLTTYARAVDTKDWELYRSCFTDDADIDYTSAGGIRGTLDEIVTWMGSTMVMFDATQHLVSNEMVEIDGDTATVRAMFYNPMHCGRQRRLLRLRRLVQPRTHPHRRRVEEPQALGRLLLDHDGQVT